MNLFDNRFLVAAELTAGEYGDIDAALGTFLNETGKLLVSLLRRIAFGVDLGELKLNRVRSKSNAYVTYIEYDSGKCHC